MLLFKLLGYLYSLNKLNSCLLGISLQQTFHYQFIFSTDLFFK